MHKEKYIGCDCMSLTHVLRFSYYPPQNETEDNVIYFSFLADLWRTDIWPLVWDKEWKYLKENFTKEHWKNYFLHSIWSHILMSFEYIFKGSTKKIIFGGTLINIDNLDELYDVFGWISDKEKESYKPITITSNCPHGIFSVTFSINNYEFLETEVYFTKANFLQRVKRGMRYLFGRYNYSHLEFEITEEQASLMKGFIKNARREAKQVKELSNILAKAVEEGIEEAIKKGNNK